MSRNNQNQLNELLDAAMKYRDAVTVYLENRPDDEQGTIAEWNKFRNATLPAYEKAKALFDKVIAKLAPPAEILQFTGKYRFLSNFFAAPVTYEGDLYPTVEHAYQAAKTEIRSERMIIRKMKAGDAKRAGQSVTLRSDWEKIKLYTMRSLVSEKFLYPDLQELLLATGNANLVEGNYWGDTFWGVCDGVGENHLGKILMDVRSRLQEKA